MIPLVVILLVIAPVIALVIAPVIALVIALVILLVIALVRAVTRIRRGRPGKIEPRRAELPSTMWPRVLQRLSRPAKPFAMLA